LEAVAVCDPGLATMGLGTIAWFVEKTKTASSKDPSAPPPWRPRILDQLIDIATERKKERERHTLKNDHVGNVGYFRR
jgi:hypothetical protein